MNIKILFDVPSHPFIFGGGVFILVLVIFVLIFILSNRKSGREKDLIPIYSVQCGGSFGFVRASFPFVRLSLYSDFLVISSYGKIIIDYSRIRELRDVGLFGSGLEIVTTNPDKYGQPIISTFNRSEIKRIIHQCLAETKHNLKHKQNQPL
ncbi:MAG: hypothetical protein ACXVPU_00570 [Bacteroidia bacterium]